MCSECGLGFFGKDCSQYCSMEETCNNRGRCLSGGCQCFAAFEGEHCFECSAGLYGEQCSIPCHANTTCSSHGRCLNTGQCECDPGFVGKDCSTCSTNYYGPACDIMCIDVITCSGHGICGGEGECVCTDGYAGASCDLCANGAVNSFVAVPFGSKVAQNLSDFDIVNLTNSSSVPTENVTNTSKDQRIHDGVCQAQCNYKTTCSSHGRCLDLLDQTAGMPKCECYGGYATASGGLGGPECSSCAFALMRSPQDGKCADYGSNSNLITLGGQILCGTNETCNGQGICMNSTWCSCFDRVSGTSCDSCEAGFFAQNCKLPCSRNHTCNGRGRCTGEGMCECDARFAGDDCSACAAGFMGEDCQKRMPECSRHGHPLSDQRCHCYPGFAGDDCSKCASDWFGKHCDVKCTDSNCSGHGSCGHRGKCICSEGYAGDQCDVCHSNLGGESCSNTCAWNSTCSAHGRCVGGMEQRYECECFGGFVNDNCSECAFPLNGGRQCADSGSSAEMIWLDGALLCGANESCSGQGLCSADFETQVCDCDQGMGGAACDVCNSSGYGQTCSLECNAKSTCHAAGRCAWNGECECHIGGFVGKFCEECPDGVFGENCTVPTCSWNTSCSGHGRCDGNGDCVCREGWIGSHCDSCAPGMFGSNCDQPCSDELKCSGHGTCRTDGSRAACICDDGFSGDTCTACAHSYGQSDCATPCSTELSCNMSGRCMPEGICECFPKFNCSRVLNSFEIDNLSSGIRPGDGLMEFVCGGEPVKNQCLEACSGDGLAQCQESLDSCVAKLGKEGSCECLGRFRMCTVDVGCETISDSAVLHLCNSLQCTQSQCQILYPESTQCDWDTHAFCDAELEQCLAAPAATVAFGDRCGYGRGAKCGEDYALEQAKYAERCSCYQRHSETFGFEPRATCAVAKGSRSSVQSRLGLVLSSNPALHEGWLPVVGAGLGQQWTHLKQIDGSVKYRYLISSNSIGNVSAFESPAAFSTQPASHNYSSSACLSGCMNEAAQAARILQIVHDCARCGDGEFMPGREECEDSNLFDGDGCSAECKVEVPARVNVSLTFSEVSSDPGTVTLTWRHSQLSLLALSEDPAGHFTNHRVSHYNLLVLREREESFSSDGQYEAHYVNRTEATTLPFFGDNCNETTCEFSILRVVGGERLSVSLTAENIAGESEPWRWQYRWTTLPFGLMDIQYADFVPRQSIELSWHAPPSTGLGNNFEVPVTSFKIQVSRCSDFRYFDYSVLFNSTQTYTLASNLTNSTKMAFACQAGDCACSNTGVASSRLPGIMDCGCGCAALANTWCETSEFDLVNQTGFAHEDYPVVYNVTRHHPGLHQGLYYFYRVTASTRMGASNTSNVFRQQFGKIPFPFAFIDYPTVFPVPVALYGEDVQPWTTDPSLPPGSPPIVSKSVLLHLSGFPLVRGVQDVELTVTTFLMNASAAASINVIESSLPDGTTLEFFPSRLPQSVISECGMPCTVDLSIRMVKEAVKTASFTLQYFYYPAAEAVGMVPTNGPIGGGTLLTLTLLDWTGSATREQADLPNLVSVYRGHAQMAAIFQMQALTWNATILSMVQSNELTVTGAVMFDVSLNLPPSLAGEGMASIVFEINGTRFNVETTGAALQFEYVGTQILYLTPTGGLLNPGSGGIQINVVVLNLPSDLTGLEILVGGLMCEVKTISTSDSELGVASAIACDARELPLSQVGLVNVTVTVDGMNKVLRSTWQYLAPPAPVIHSESVMFDGRSELWIPAGKRARTARIKIQNLSPKYSVFFDQIVISFYAGLERSFNVSLNQSSIESNDKPATDMSFLPVGTDLDVTFMTPTMMPPSWMYVNVSILHKNGLVMTLTHFSDGSPFHVEFRDVEQPRTIAAAPTEASTSGGLVWVAGIQSFDAFFQGGSTVTTDFSGTATSNRRRLFEGVTSDAEILAVMSVAEYLERGTRYIEVMSIPKIESWFLGISNDYRDDVVQKTTAAIEDSALFPAEALKVAALVFVWIPSRPAGLVPVKISAGPAQVDATFVYTENPVGRAKLLNAATDAGDLRSGLAGGVRVMVVLTNFAIVYKGTDISVQFGEETLGVSRLAYSTSSETKFYLIVPPSLPAVVQVKVFPTVDPSNEASFSFTYWDDRMPVLTSLSPYLVYETGGKTINITVVDLPLLASRTQYRIVVRQGMSVSTVSLEWLSFGLDGASCSFVSPPGIAGKASVEIWADVDATVSKGSNLMAMEFAAIPDTPATVLRLEPSETSNLKSKKVSVFISNMKEVPSQMLVRVQITLKGVTKLLDPVLNTTSRIYLLSTMSQTLVSFNTPEFLVGGTALVQIWEVGREHLAAETHLTYIDENVAMLVYSFPDVVRANEEAIVEVGIARMGELPVIGNMYASACCNASASIVSAYKTAQLNTVLVVKLRKLDHHHGYVNVTVAACPDVQACLKKSVQFTFYFRDPTALWVNDMSPRSMYIDGRLPVVLDIENVPSGLTPRDVIVTFRATNATVQSIDYKPVEIDNGLFQVMVTFNAPGVSAPEVMEPLLQIPSLSFITRLPKFTYLIAPSPTFSDPPCVPARAKTTLASPIQVTLLNFPGVSVKADIEIQFRWSSGKVVPASVSEFSRIEPSKHPLAIQDITVLIFSPIGSEVQEGAVQIWAFHGQYRRRVAKTGSAFSFIDATSPEIVGAVSTGVDAGTNSIKVQMSKATEVSLYIGNAKNRVAQVVLGTGYSSSGNVQYPFRGPTFLDLATSSHDAASKSAKISFSVPGASKSGDVFGLVKFQAGCGGDECGSAACCESSACIEQCKDIKGDSCKMACFKLQYFDDLQPRITFSSELEGPEIGGSVIQLTIAMLPKVEPGAPLSAVFDGRPELMGSVYVRSSTLLETTLDLVTPAIALQGLPSKVIQVVLKLLSRPDRPLNFRYTVRAVSPSLKSLNPSSCFSNKATPVTISIQYFPYPGDAVVVFGDNLQLASESVTVLSVSNLQKSIITFLSPEILEPGMYQVLVFPKSCPKCGKSISFSFLLRDPNQPELVKPIPSQGQRFPGPSVLDFVRVSKFPSYVDAVGYTNSLHIDLVIRFHVPREMNTSVYSTKPSSFELKSGGIAQLSYRRPPLPVGPLNISIDITTKIRGGNGTEIKSAVFPFVIYDETAIRTVSLFPAAVSTRLSLYGRALDLRSTVDLLIANFPPRTLSSEVSISMVGGLIADVLSVTEVSSCRDLYGDCNRTRLSILLPAVDPPGVWSGELSIKGNPILTLDLTYFAPCNYERFCEAAGMIVDKQMLQTLVPSSRNCEPKYCLNVANLLDPSIVSFFPSEGPSTGGTMVSVLAKNLPAFLSSDLVIEVGSAASKQSISAETVVQEPGSSTTSSSGEFTFKMPSVAGGVFGVLSQTSVTLKVSLGMNIRSAGFSFQYTPVIQGPAECREFYPRQAFPNVDVEVKVQLVNFPKLPSLDPTQIRLQLKNTPGDDTSPVDFAASAIQSSGFESTLFSFRTGGLLQVSTKRQVIHVYYSVHGLARAGSFEFEVLPAPTPTVFSLFPVKGRANVALNQAVTILYIEPTMAAQSIWAVSLSGLVSKMLAPPTIVTQSTVGCTQRHCARHLVQFQVPKSAGDASFIPLDGGTVVVKISAGADSVEFPFTFDADDTPSVESIEPSSMSIESVALISMYLKNVEERFCSTLATCSVTFGGRAGTVTSASYSNKIKTLVIMPPAMGAGGSVAGLISDGAVTIPFDYIFVAPPASLEPIDGACSGGDTITIRVLGWGEVAESVQDISVVFGGTKEATVTQIVDSVASVSYSLTTLHVTSPILSSKGTHDGVVTLRGQKTSPFSYECFDKPAALASPASATLDGRTSSSDGRTVSLFLSNFPAVATSADVVVRFGSVTCDARACSVVSVTNGITGVTLVLTPPELSSPANVLLSATYTGKAEPPKNGDPSKVYVRAQKTAQTEFRHYRPQPVVLSARWCSECVPGSRTCIANGKCADKAPPKSNAMGSSGTGVLTVVADNLPQIPISAQSAAVLSPAKVEVTFGDLFGTVKKVNHNDM